MLTAPEKDSKEFVELQKGLESEFRVPVVEAFEKHQLDAWVELFTMDLEIVSALSKLSVVSKDSPCISRERGAYC